MIVILIPPTTTTTTTTPKYKPYMCLPWVGSATGTPFFWVLNIFNALTPLLFRLRRLWVWIIPV